MESFSQRKGLKPIKSVIQVDSMDDELRNRLWNALTASYWDRVETNGWGQHCLSYKDNKNINVLFRRLWHNYFKKPIDTLTDRWDLTLQEIRDYFFNCKWFEVYDFVEFIANNYREKYSSVNQKFMEFCNDILKEEVSAYRFVNGTIVQLTSEEEIAEIEGALKASSPVANHLKRSLDLFADRTSPDYRNSIKESISAVEAICRLITGSPKATLGQALKQIEDEVKLHPALKSAFNNLYGYTSDAEGIRHALLDEPNLDFEDAKFMLVSCSAFINYLISKSSKAGIGL